MAKLTKKQYTRKALFAAVAIFVAAVLVVSGIAVWLLFGELSSSSNGGINVSEVASSPLSFAVLRIDDRYVEDGETLYGGFILDSQKNDNEGRVCWDGTSSEKMSITVSGIIENARHLSSFSYTLAMPQGVIDAAKKGYLDISDYYDAKTGTAKEIDVPLSENGQFVADGLASVWRFEFIITLKWGTLFNNINPSIYYDSAEGLKIPLDTVTEVLNDMRRLVNGTTGHSVYTLTLTAKPNK